MIIGYCDTIGEWQKCTNKRFVTISEHSTVVLDQYVITVTISDLSQYPIVTICDYYSSTTALQSTIDADASATDTATATHKVRWASLYSCDMAVENESEEDYESHDGVNLRRSTLLIHISPDDKIQH